MALVVRLHNRGSAQAENSRKFTNETEFDHDVTHIAVRGKLLSRFSNL